MKKTYQALRAWARRMLLQDGAEDDPTPPYYEYPPSLTPNPFMGLGQFVAGRIHQMRAGKSYRAAHPSWSDEDHDLTCPRCGIEPDTFQHGILSYPARERDRDLLLKDVSALGQDPNLWTEPLLLHALGEYIVTTKTGFPPDMTPENFFPPTTGTPRPRSSS